jgi:hypothetical protein
MHIRYHGQGRCPAPTRGRCAWAAARLARNAPQIGNRLVCVPDRQDDARSMRDATERFYEQYAAERDAWRSGK